MLNITIVGNKFIGLTARQGGAVQCDNPAAYLSFINNDVTNCVAQFGAAIYKIGQRIIEIYHFLILSIVQKAN